MAVVDDISRRSPAAEFERTPPQDVAAEQCVLGGMLLSKDAIADVVESVRPADFYRPAHQVVFEAILDLYAKGEPADPITVAHELDRRGQLARVGGTPYLHTLMSSVPTAANASYYAGIVTERAILRRLVEAGTRIVQLGYGVGGGQGGEVDDIVDRAQAAIYEVTERRASEDYALLETLLQPTLDEIEAIGTRGGVLTGVPTGIAEMDELTNGLHPGQLIILAARPGIGKALALSTALPTPSGWTTMGEVEVGDLLLDAEGRPTRVIATSEVSADRSCYQVEFSDGTLVVADGDHQWLTMARDSVPFGLSRVVTTEEIAATLRGRSVESRPNHAVEVTRAFDLPAADLPVDPYLLGVWLGAGDSASARITLADEEVVARVAATGQGVTELSGRGLSAHGLYGLPGLQSTLGALEVLGNKHVPMAYLRAAAPQRRALLAGLIDTAGPASTSTSTITVELASERLARDAADLAVTLGQVVSKPAQPVERRQAPDQGVATAYQVTFTVPTAPHSPGIVVRSGRTAPGQTAEQAVRPRLRYVLDVSPLPSVPVRCVQVDNAAGLYLASRAAIPTHNSTLGLDIGRSASIKHNLASVIFSLEMTKSEITMRLLSAEARVALHHMRTGSMTDDDWARLARRMGEVADAPLYIDDSPNLTMMEIRAKARRLKQRHDLRLVVVDYMQLMTSHGRVESRQQEVSQISRSLKLLAKELSVPVVAISQLNRNPEQRADKRPQLSDLRECLTGDTLITRCDTGQRVPIRELVGAGDIPVWSVDERLRLRRAVMTDVWCTGVRQVYRCTLASGRIIQTTGNHPLLTIAGWRPLGQLSAGDHVAVARWLPEPPSQVVWSAAELVLLAHLLGDGCLSRDPIYYCTADEDNASAVVAAAHAFGVQSRVTTRCDGLRLVHFGAAGRSNPLYTWLRHLGLFGTRSYEKFLPAELFSLDTVGIQLFLRHLWATDGSVTRSANGRTRVYYATTSRRLADDLQSLLLRVDIRARLRRSAGDKGRPLWTLDVSGGDQQRHFLSVVGCHGVRGRVAAQLLESMTDTSAATNVDVIPAAVWDHVRKVMHGHMTARQLAAGLGMSYSGGALYRAGLSRARMARVAAIVPDPYLHDLSRSDVAWDKVVSVASAGVEEVYDAHVPGTHSFLAGDLVSHNSGAIEMDADIVILLHREDAYEKESPRAGEADLIVAKHRNGPTRTVTVAFQGHYSRFVDMVAG